jgi:hypothetical protein
MSIPARNISVVKTSMDVPAMKCYHKNTGREKL